MPAFGSALRLNKIPVQGLVPETSGTAPASPAVGQLWVDTSTANTARLKVWDGDEWVIVDLRVGTTAGTVAAGDDSRITGAAQKSANLSDLANAATARTNLGLGDSATRNVGTAAGTVAAGDDSRITGAEQVANKNATNGYAGLSSGKIAFAQIPTAASGAATADTVVIATDSRLSDQRTPLDNSVTSAKIVDGAITDVDVNAANKDGAAGTASMRTLGTGAQQAMAGNTRLDQVTAPTAAVNLNSQRITNLGAPSAASDAARLQDVQNAQAGIDIKPSVRVATTANIDLTTGGLLTIDGVTVAAGNRVLVKNQTTASQNGLYVAAAGAWTRTTDEITANTFVFVEEGTSQADTAWMVSTNDAITVGTTAITWAQFGGATTYTGTSNRITVSGTVIDIASTYVGQTSITTLGTVTTGTWSAGTIAVARGGTGATTAAAARTNLGAIQVGYSATLGAITAGTPLTVTHNLGTQDVIVQIRDASSNEHVNLDVVNASTTTVTVTSGISYAANALRIVIIPVA